MRWFIKGWSSFKNGLHRLVQSYLSQETDDNIPALVEALKDSDWVTQWSAARALGRLGEAGAPAVPALVEGLGDANGFVRQTFVETLGQIGAPAVPALMQALKDERSHVRLEATRALGRIGPPAADAVPALLDALGRIGTPAADAALAWLEALPVPGTDISTSERWTVEDCLKRIGASTVPALVEMMRDERIIMRQSAAKALSGLARSEASVLVISVLEEALEDIDLLVRVHAAHGLQWLVAHPAALPVLVAALKSEDGEARGEAKMAFSSVGAAGVPALLELLQDSDDGVRSAAVRALENIGPPAVEAVLPLANALNDENESVREAAVFALNSIGIPPPADAVPALARMYTGVPHPQDIFAGYRSRSVIELLERIGTPEALAALRRYPRQHE